MTVTLEARTTRRQLALGALVAVGLACVAVGAWLLLGVGALLMVAGCVLVAAGLLVDGG